MFQKGVCVVWYIVHVYWWFEQIGIESAKNKSMSLSMVGGREWGGGLIIVADESMSGHLCNHQSYSNTHLVHQSAANLKHLKLEKYEVANQNIYLQFQVILIDPINSME